MCVHIDFSAKIKRIHKAGDGEEIIPLGRNRKIFPLLGLPMIKCHQQRPQTTGVVYSLSDGGKKFKTKVSAGPCSLQMFQREFVA